MNLMSFLTKFSWLDWIGLALFVASWIGYEQVVEHGWFRTKRLREETNKLRLKWAYVMLKRDPRVSDAAMIANLLPASPSTPTPRSTSSPRCSPRWARSTS